MKNKLLFKSFIIAIFLSSCTQEQSLNEESDLETELNMYDKAYIIDATLEEQLNYRQFHLSSLIEELNRSGIKYSEIFTTDSENKSKFNSLSFNDLLISNNVDKKSNSVSEKTILSLGAFEGVSETDLLPYLRKIKDGDSSDPLFLISTYDVKREEEIVIGLKFNEKGKLKVVDKDVTEDEIFGSTSKRASSSAVYITDANDCGGNAVIECGDGGGGGGSTSSSSIKLDKIQIRDKKDSWVNNAEIRVVIARSSGNLSNTVRVNACGQINAACTHFNGHWLAQYNNSEIRNGRTVTVNRLLAYNTNSTAHYTIFEYDRWPAPVQRYVRKVNNTTLEAEYRSYQSPYHNFTFTTNNIPEITNDTRYRKSYTLDNSAIKYNFRQK